LVGAAAGATRSTLRFDGELELDIHQYAMMASAGHVRPSGLAIRAAFGTVVDGALAGDGRTHDIGPGIVGAVSAAKQWTRGDWFVTATLAIAASRTKTAEPVPGAPRESLIAADLRAGGMVGRTFGRVSPYVLVRAFGGPVLWTLDDEQRTGTDVHHYQLGAGASLVAGSGLSLLVDVAALGERSASLGMSLEL
jgi:hypothetical protein